MKFTAKFKNFGKLQDATLHFNDLTVLAGTNSTGKSYVSRLLYCIFDAINKDPLQGFYANVVKKFADDMQDIRTFQVNTNDTMYDVDVDDFARSLLDKVSTVEEHILYNRFHKHSTDTYSRDKDFIELIKPLVEEKDTLLSDLEDWEDSIRENVVKEMGIIAHEEGYHYDPRTIGESVTGDWDNVEKLFNNLDDLLKLRLEEKEENGYISHITENLKDNFQVKGLISLLGKDKSASAMIEVEFSNGKNNDKKKITLNIDDEGKVSGKVDINGANLVSNVLYLASPVHWSLQNPISDMAVRKLIGKREYLGGIPKYVHDSYITLRYQNIDAPSAAISTIVKGIEDVIGGEIKYDSNQNKLEFFEVEEGKESKQGGISLLLTASGIVQLGMLAFFLKNRTIDKKTVLFMDEPEAHLHVEWQEKVMKVLYLLKEYGVTVIIATHSSTMMQKLELEINNNNSKNKVALNLFSKDGKFGHEAYDFETINGEIASSMNETAYRMFMQE